MEVLPNTKRFVQDFKAKVLPGARQVGDEIGNVAGAAAAKRLGDRLKDGIDEGFRKSDPARQGGKQGEEFAGAFVDTLKARLQAASRSLPKFDLDANATPAQRKIAELRARLDTLGKAKIGVDVTDRDALLQVEKIKAELKLLTSKNQDISVRFDARAALGEVEQLTQAVQGIGANAAEGGGGLPGGPAAIGGAIAAGLALVGPASGAAVAGLGAVAGAGGTALLALKGIEAQVKANTDTGRAYESRLVSLKSTLGGLEQVAVSNVTPGWLSALDKVNAYAPELAPVVASISRNLGAAGSETASALITALRVASPLLEDGGRYAELLAVKLNNAAHSPEFRQFIGYARAELPAVGKDLLDIASAGVHLAIALQPIGDELLKDLDGMVKIADGAAKIAAVVDHIPHVAPSIISGINPALPLLGMLGNSNSKNAKQAKELQTALDNLAASLGSLPGPTSTQQQQIQNLAQAYHLTTSQVSAYAALLGVSTDQADSGKITNAQLAATVAKVASAYDNATQSGSEYLQALSSFASSGGSAADRAALIGATLKAANGDAISYAKSMADAASANQQFVTDFDNARTAALNAHHAFDLAKTGVVDLTKGTINYRNAASAPLIADLQAMQDAAVKAAGATYQHEVATKGAALAAADAAHQYYGQTHDALISEATQLGLTKDQAKRLADQYLSLPADITTRIKAVGTDPVLDVLKAIGKQLSYLTHEPFVVNTDANTAPALGKIAALRADLRTLNGTTAYVQVQERTVAGQAIGGRQGFATGGYVADGPGTETSDSILARLSLHEFVSNARATARNRAALEAANRGARLVALPGFADGGFVGVSAPSVAKRTAGSKAAAKAASTLAAAQANLRFTASLDLSRLTSTGTASAIGSVIRKLITDVHTAASKGLGSDSLIPTLQAENSQLGRLATERVNLTNKIKSAAAGLAQQRADAAAESAKVAGGIGGVFDITSLDGPAQFGTANPAAFLQNLRLEAQQVDNANAQIAKLRGLGLDKHLVQQLGEKGAAAFPAIQSLSTASAAQVAEIDALYARVQASSKATGDQIAGSLFQPGIDSAIGYIRGLDSQLSKVRAAASRLAQTVIKQIDKDLDIHSPSRKARWRGQMTGEGFALGVADRYGMVTRSATGLANAAVRPAQFSGGSVREVPAVHVHPSPNHSETAIGVAAARHILSRFA